jgi:hypothetical protein
VSSQAASPTTRALAPSLVKHAAMVSWKATNSAIAVEQPAVVTTSAATLQHASLKPTPSVTTRTKTVAATVSSLPQALSAVLVLANVTPKRHATEPALIAPRIRPSLMEKGVAMV